MIIEGKDIDEVLYKTSKELLNAAEYSPRGFKTKELIKPQLIIENPNYCIITNKARKFSNKYLKAELEWYLSGEKSIDKIKHCASMWEKIKNTDGTANSNYGEIVFKQRLENFDGNQFDWVIKKLKDDKDSRQAIINYNQTKHKYDLNKDFVCTIDTQYLIRNDKLISFNDMRSNDLIYGFSYDFPFFSYLHNEIYNELKKTFPELKSGRIIHTPTSLHVYEKHFKMLEDIIKEYENNDIQSKELKDIYK